MNYPYRLYIDFLVIKYLTYEAIVENCKSIGIVVPTETEIEQYKEEMLSKCNVTALKNYLTKGKKIDNAKTFLGYMHALGIHELWLTESDYKNNERMNGMVKARELFENARHRHELCCFILANFSYDEIAQAFASKYNMDIRDSVVYIFKKHFWNIELMTRQLWIDFLRRCPADQMRTFLIAMNESKDFVRYELKFKTVIEYYDALNEVFTTAYFKFKEHTRKGTGMENERNARAWASTLIDVGDRREELNTGNIKNFTEALQMKFTFEETKFPSYADLK